MASQPPERGRREAAEEGAPGVSSRDQAYLGVLVALGLWTLFSALRPHFCQSRQVGGEGPGVVLGGLLHALRRGRRLLLREVAVMDADEVGYREALRAYCRAGRDEALQIQKGAA